MFMSSQPWSEQHIPDLTGRLAVVTGANAGTGFETARALAVRGATVILACRDTNKATAAMDAIRAAHPQARLAFERLDLGSLASIRAAAKSIVDRHPRIDLLVNNAGVMVPPRGRTADGFETQLGTNHLGPFAFTGLLLDRLLAAPVRSRTDHQTGCTTSMKGATPVTKLPTMVSSRPICATPCMASLGGSRAIRKEPATTKIRKQVRVFSSIRNRTIMALLRSLWLRTSPW